MLCGMTGTAREVAREFWNVYHLPTLRVATHKPVIRQRLADRIFASREEKVASRGRACGQVSWPGPPGAHRHPFRCRLRTVVASGAPGRAGPSGPERQAGCGGGRHHRHGRCYREHHHRHQHGGDAARISCLQTGLREKGGLHVIITERHEAARIDRQLAGRCGRQGDPGSFEGHPVFGRFSLRGRPRRSPGGFCAAYGPEFSRGKAPASTLGHSIGPAEAGKLSCAGAQKPSFSRIRCGGVCCRFPGGWSRRSGAFELFSKFCNPGCVPRTTLSFFFVKKNETKKRTPRVRKSRSGRPSIFKMSSPLRLRCKGKEKPFYFTAFKNYFFPLYRSLE